VIDHKDAGAGSVIKCTVGASGVLTDTAVEFATGVGPSMIAINPAGTFAYVSNFDAATISQYSINAGDGNLLAIGTGSVNSGNSPFSVTIAGNYAYASNYDNGATDTTISQYSIGGSGALTAMTPATVAAGKGPTYLVVDPSGKCAFVGNVGSNNISMYTIATGKLTPNSPATVGPSTSPVWMAIKGP